MDQDPVDLLCVLCRYASIGKIVLCLHPGRWHHLDRHIIQAVYFPIDRRWSVYGNDPLKAFCLFYDLTHGGRHIKDSAFLWYASLVHVRHFCIKCFQEIGRCDHSGINPSGICSKLCMELAETVAVLLRNRLLCLKRILNIRYR